MERCGTGAVMAAPGAAAGNGAQAGGAALTRPSPQGGENGVGSRAVRVGTRRSQVGGTRCEAGLRAARSVPGGAAAAEVTGGEAR